MQFWLDEVVSITERDRFTFIQVLQGVGGFSSLMLILSKIIFDPI
jgi:hypothetical protein